jgi:hypothetical protein
MSADVVYLNMVRGHPVAAQNVHGRGKQEEIVPTAGSISGSSIAWPPGTTMAWRAGARLLAAGYLLYRRRIYAELLGDLAHSRPSRRLEGLPDLLPGLGVERRAAEPHSAPVWGIGGLDTVPNGTITLARPHCAACLPTRRNIAPLCRYGGGPSVSGWSSCQRLWRPGASRRFVGRNATKSVCPRLRRFP